MEKPVQLITYADRLGGTLRQLGELLDGPFEGLFGGVHILPFFDPIDGADAGFDPVDHTRVDARLGEWQDVADIASRYRVMADLIVNHISADSAQFADVRANATASPHWPLFLRRDDVFNDDEDAAIRRIYRPRPGSPFTTIALDDGSTHDFWTTFSAKQLDINVECAAGRDYLERILQTFAGAGIRELRLDAAGYAIKRAGTRCFMLPETYDFIAALSNRASELGMQVLVEIHAHHQTQIEIAERVGRVYDFALPPLVLHTLYTGNSRALKQWLDIAPRNCVTVLDTHDGIGIVDVGRDGDRAGLLDDDQIRSLIAGIHQRTGGDSEKASGHSASNLDVYQINSTYYDALGRDDTAYLIARAIQFFAPGSPQVYYVGLLAGHSDLDLMRRTGVGRDVNRHYYTPEEIDSAVARPVVRDLFELIRLRNGRRAFDGAFSMPSVADDQLALRWRHADETAELRVWLAEPRATIEFTGSAATRSFVIEGGALSELADAGNRSRQGG